MQKAACKKQFLKFLFIHLFLTALGLRCFSLLCSSPGLLLLRRALGFLLRGLLFRITGSRRVGFSSSDTQSQQLRVLELAGFGSCGARLSRSHLNVSCCASQPTWKGDRSDGPPPTSPTLEICTGWFSCAVG